MDRIQKLLDRQMHIKAQLLENEVERNELKQKLQQIENELQDIEFENFNLYNDKQAFKTE